MGQNPFNDPWFSVATFVAFHSAIPSTSPPGVAVSIFGGTIFFRLRWSFSQWRDEQMIDKLFPVPVGDSKIPIFRDSIVSYNFRMNLTYAINLTSLSHDFTSPTGPSKSSDRTLFWEQLRPRFCPECPDYYLDIVRFEWKFKFFWYFQFFHFYEFLVFLLIGMTHSSQPPEFKPPNLTHQMSHRRQLIGLFHNERVIYSFIVQGFTDRW